MIEQRASRRAPRAGGEHVALAVLEPLAIFELAQFVGDADQHIGIRADPKGTAGTDEFASRENAVAEACLSDGAKAGDCASLGEGSDFFIRRVGGVNEA